MKDQLTSANESVAHTNTHTHTVQGLFSLKMFTVHRPAIHFFFKFKYLRGNNFETAKITLKKFNECKYPE